MLKTINGGIAPTKGSKYSACIDLYAREDVVIGAGETVKIPLGVCIDDDELNNAFKYHLLSTANPMSDIFIDTDFYDMHLKNSIEQLKSSHYLSIHPRSSIGVKGLIIPNGMGIIDLDYRGEIMLILHNPIEDIEHNWEDDDREPSSVRHNLNYSFEIRKGDKIAQVMLCEHKTYLLGVDTEEERTGGFGSTNKGEENV